MSKSEDWESRQRIAELRRDVIVRNEIESAADGMWDEIKSTPSGKDLLNTVWVKTCSSVHFYGLLHNTQEGEP